MKARTKRPCADRSRSRISSGLAGACGSAAVDLVERPALRLDRLPPRIEVREAHAELIGVAGDVEQRELLLRESGKSESQMRLTGFVPEDGRAARLGGGGGASAKLRGPISTSLGRAPLRKLSACA